MSEFSFSPESQPTATLTPEQQKKALKGTSEAGKKWRAGLAIGGGIVTAGGLGAWLYNIISFNKTYKEAKEEVTGGAGNEPIQVIQNQYADYDFRQIGNIGLERTGIHLKDLSDPRALINKPFLRLAAKFGDDFLVPSIVNAEGNLVQEVSDAVVTDWVNGLKLNTAEAADFRQNYVFYQTHPQEFGQFLLKHGALPTVVDFLSKAEELKTQDSDPVSWFGGAGNPQDRYEKLQEWLMENNIIISKIERKVEKNIVFKENDFQEVADLVCRNLGVDYGEIGGPLETLSCMPIDTTKMHEEVGVDYYASAYNFKPSIDKSGLSYAVLGLFLLRVGPSWPKEVIAKASERLEDVYYWFKLGQPERVMRNLMVLGKQAWDRVTGKKD